MKHLSLQTGDVRTPSLHFNLKQLREANRLTQIMLVTTVNRRRIRIYTKLRVEPKYWNPSTHRCHTEQPPHLRDRLRLKSINERIESLVTLVCDEDRRLAQLGEHLSGFVLRKLVKQLLLDERDLHDPIACLRRLVDEYEQGVNRNGRRGNVSTKVAYYTALARLSDFCARRHTPLTSFDDFNKRFFTEFTNYLYSHTYGSGAKHYTQNTVMNTLKVVKNLLHRAYDNDLTSNNYFHKVQTTLPAAASEQIYLTEEEIGRLSKVRVYNEQELAVRNLFVIACYTALRISDLQQLNGTSVRNGFITLYQIKTKELVEIPVLKEIAPLVEHYCVVGFPTLCRARANRIIKTLAARCRISEPVVQKEHRGGEVHFRTLPKHELVSFHTARRSCVTNLYKRGYPINYVMSLSGHRSIQAFQRYMRATSNEVLTDFVHLLKKEKAIRV